MPGSFSLKKGTGRIRKKKMPQPRITTDGAVLIFQVFYAAFCAVSFSVFILPLFPMPGFFDG